MKHEQRKDIADDEGVIASVLGLGPRNQQTRKRMGPPMEELMADPVACTIGQEPWAR